MEYHLCLCVWPIWFENNYCWSGSEDLHLFPFPQDSLTQMSSGYDWQNCWRATLWWIRSGCGTAFLIHSLWLFSVFTDSHLSCHCQISVNFSIFSYFVLSQPFVLLFISLILRLLGHFGFTWPYLNVIILKPQPTLNPLSTELKYSLLILIIPNPSIDAVSRN